MPREKTSSGSGIRSTLAPTRLALALAAALGATSALANPSGAAVVSGQAGIAASGRTLTVTNTPGAIIQWRGFSIGPDELTRFIQQSSRSSVLNRVVGQDPSQLLGRLESNGRVFLINPNGIVFGAGARVDVAGLVASTLDLADADFLAGRWRFDGPAGAGSLTQLGTITTPAGGQVVLIAPRIDQAGIVASPGGEIVLAAGQSVQLVDTADPALRVTVADRPGEVVNVGELVAAGGRIGIHAGLIRHDGTVSADRAEPGAGGEVLLRGGAVGLGAASRTSASGADAGRITIDAGAGRAVASGRLEAAATGGRGGAVRILGGEVEARGARIDASGATGGGEILVGGGAQGRDASVGNARTTTVDASTTLRADAGGAGNGGSVVVWADGATAFAGSASARGGTTGGDGGFVEVSGKETLDFRGTVDSTAARGRTGTLLLDPSDITISTAANATISAGPTFTGTAATSNLNVTTLQTALATNNVVVDTTSGFASAGNIDVASAVTWASGNSLELRAHGNITVGPGAPINATGLGALRLVADQDLGGGGDVTLHSALTARLGGIAISGVNVLGLGTATLSSTGLANQNAGPVTIAARGTVALGGAIAASGGAASAGNVGRDGGSVTITGTRVDVAAVAASGSSGAGGGAGGTVRLTGTAGIASAAITASGGVGVGTNMSGGRGGSIAFDNTVAGSVVAIGALTASSGSATGTGAGGTPGLVSLSNGAGSIQTVGLSTQGGSNGAGGAIDVTATGAISIGGAVVGSGGAGTAGMAGGAAGAIAIVSTGAGVTTTTLTASGGNGGSGSGAAGGDAATLAVTSADALSIGAVVANGGSAGGTAAAGGAGGAVTLATTGAAGTLTTGSLTARTGASTGARLSGAAGALVVAGGAAALVQTGAIDTRGQAGGAGGAVSLASAGNVTVTGSITTSGGALNAATAAAGRRAGDITVRGVNRSLAGGSLTASGGAAIVSGQAGGDAGTVRLTGVDGTAATAGSLVTAAVVASTGNALGAGPGGAPGSLTLDGTTVTATALTSTGGTNGGGGAITAAASSGLLNVTGTIAASGGTAAAGSAGNRAGAIDLFGQSLTPLGIVSANGSNGNGSGFAGGNGGHVAVTVGAGALAAGTVSVLGGNGGSGDAAGGNAGTIGLDAGGGSPLITLSGTLTATGGNRSGTAAAGAGGAVRFHDPVGLGASVTVNAGGGSAGSGAGGALRFDGAIDSTGAARALTLNTNGAVTLDGPVGAGTALSVLTTNAGGSTRINGGSVRTTSGLTFGDAVTLGGDTSVDGGTGTTTFSAAVDGGFRLAVASTGNVTFTGALGGVAPLDSLGVSGRTVTIGSASIGNGAGAGVDLAASRNIVATGTVLSNGAPITLVANPAGTATGNFRGIQLTNATFDSGTGDITMTGTGGTTTNDTGVRVVDSMLRATGSGRITLTGIGGAVSGRGVSVSGTTAAHTVTTVDGDIEFTGTASGTVAATLSADVYWSGASESALQATGAGAVRLTGLGSGDFQGVALGTVTTPLDYDGPALNRWQVSTASSLVYTGLGIAKTSGGDSTWTITAPGSVEFSGAAGITSSSGKLHVVMAPATGAVRLGTGTFRTNGGDLTLAGGSNPGGRVDPSLPATGARGTASTFAGIDSSADIDAGGGSVWIMGTGYTGANDGNYGIKIGSTSGTAQVITSGAGSITMTGFGGGSAAASDNAGVFLGQGTVQTGATGSIAVTGTGGNTATGSRNMGVRLFAFNTTQALGSGSITISGRSGDAGAGVYNPGIDAAGTVAGGGGAVTLTGIAGDAPGTHNVGVVAIGRVTNIGAGSVTVVGSGGSHAGSTSAVNHGVGFSDAQFSTVDGDLTVIGTGGSGGGSGNSGLVFPLAGTSGYGGTSLIRTTGAGHLALTGIAGPGGTGIVQAIPDLVSTTGSGRITVEADSLAVTAARAIVSATGLTIRPVSAGTPLVVGTGAAGALTLDDVALAGLDWAADSALTLGGAGTGAATVATAHVFARPLVVVTGIGADITLAAPLASSSAGAPPALVLHAGRNFVNTAGNASIAAGAGRWHVYSTDPRADARGGLAADFRQYDATYATTPVQGSGNGYLYRVAPTLAVGIAGPVVKTYDGTTAATFAAANFSVAGAIDGDAVTVAAGPAAYDTRHVGSDKPIGSTWLAASASHAGKPVYGYRLTTSQLAGAVGTIVPAPLVVRADDRTRAPGDLPAPLTASFGGFVASETPAVLAGSLLLESTATPTSGPGLYRIAASGLSASNYAIAYFDGVDTVLSPVLAPVLAPVLDPVPGPVPSPVPSPVLAAVPAPRLAPSTASPDLFQRDLRSAVLLGGGGGGGGCAGDGIEAPSFSRWIDRPFGVRPACPAVAR